ncbi:hypothetical protein AB0J81_07760 [Streptomyces bobili]|uniref:hypothetical protein n=1 Tax=Streptomyces bobili TaxID=67280 RepID=UPI00341B4507
MARLTEDDKAANEQAIRAAMERLLRGELPSGGKCDLKSLAAAAGVARTGFYPKRNRDGSQRPGPYQHLAVEFERRLRELQETGDAVDPRIAQIVRLKAEVAELQKRVAKRDADLADLTKFKALAISRLAAQHDEILMLREHTSGTGNVWQLRPVLGDDTPR